MVEKLFHLKIKSMTPHEILKKAKELYPTDISKGHIYNDLQYDKQQAFIEGARTSNKYEERFFLSSGDQCTVKSNGNVLIQEQNEKIERIITISIRDIAVIKSVYESLQPF